MKIKVAPVLLLMALALSGCSENGFWFRSGSRYEDTPEKGVYYIGQPYRIKGVLYTPAEDMNYHEKGAASWYSRDDQNRLTTNGEVFDDDKMTAAHKTLPLPSLVRITNLDNGNTAIVRVNDRGPAVNNRLIDVSRKTAEALEMPETGTTMVLVDILPDESRRLKADLEERKDPEQSPVSDIIPDPSTPIYQPQDHAGEEIYNGLSPKATVTVETLPPEVETKSTDKPKAISSADWRIQAGVFGQQANTDRAIQKLGQIAPISTRQKGTMTTVFVGPFKTRSEAQSILKAVQEAGYKDAWIQHVK